MAQPQGSQDATQQMVDLSVTSTPKPRLTPDELKSRAKAKQEQHKKDMQRWTQAALNLTPSPGRPTQSAQAPPPNPNELIKANFFQVTFDGQAQLHRYAVKFGQINGKDPVKRELRRYLVHQLVTTNVPSTAHWASDYHSSFVCAGRLYNVPADSFTKTFNITPRPGTPAVAVQATITYEGIVDVAAIGRHVSPSLQNRVKLTFPAAEHFRALNIITWKQINDMAWPGG